MFNKMRYPLVLFLALAAVLALAACGGAAAPSPAVPTATEAPAPAAAPAFTPVTFTDVFSHTLTFEKPAARIISLAPGNTEILFAIGAGGQVVGRDMFSDYPEAVKAVADIGGGFGQLNTEGIVAQKPDLVLASALTPSEQVQALEALDIPVFGLANPRTLKDLYDLLAQVGGITGHVGEAQALAAQLQARVTAVEAKIAGVTERLQVFYELDSTDVNAPWTPGPGTFIDTLIQMSGGENVGASLQGDWAQISLEQLLVQDPDIILLGDFTFGGVTPEMVIAREGWGGLTAVKGQKIYTVDDNLISRPGPRLVDGLEMMAKLLHPELFP